MRKDQKTTPSARKIQRKLRLPRLPILWQDASFRSYEEAPMYNKQQSREDVFDARRGIELKLSGPRAQEMFDGSKILLIHSLMVPELASVAVISIKTLTMYICWRTIYLA
jgi:hypothetical protein